MTHSIKGSLFRATLAACLVAMPGPVLGQRAGKVVVKQYEDGGVYEGTFRDRQRHGVGTFRLPNGYRYSGAWVDGEIQGEGEAFPRQLGLRGKLPRRKATRARPHLFPDGGSDEDDWQAGEFNGMGVTIHARGPGTRASSVTAVGMDRDASSGHRTTSTKGSGQTD